MFAFKKVFASVYLAVLCATAATAAPYPITSKYATHRTREISPSFKLETYHPASTYEVRTAPSSSHILRLSLIVLCHSDLRGWCRPPSV